MSMINSEHFSNFYNSQSRGYQSHEDYGDNEFMWIDYILQSNPSGAMKFVSKNGYVGFLEAHDLGELKSQILKILTEKGDKATVELLREHPEYEAFKEIFTGDGKGLKSGGYLSATGDSSEGTDIERVLIENEKTKRIIKLALAGLLLYWLYKNFN